MPKARPWRTIQIGVGLLALQGDADDHLAEGSAGDSVGAPQGLRPKQHMDAESASLAHYPVQQQRRRLRNPVGINEELLELVNDQQRPRDRLGASRTLV